MSSRVEQNVFLSTHTTLKVGGSADYFVVVNNLAELKEALLFSQKTKVPLAILGGGSNVLVGDEGYRGLVIKNHLTGISDTVHGDNVYIKTGSGETLDDLVQYAVDKNYWGLENLSAIPGTVGATPIQNVGAYGVEVADLITEVSALNKETGEVKNFSNKECQFAYRDSFFKTLKGKEWIITEVVFKLSLNKSPKLDYGSLKDLKYIPSLTPAKIRDEVIKIRSGKFPNWREVGTAGSFFKNPIIETKAFVQLQSKYPEIVGHAVDESMTKVSLGWVLDKICGLRGYQKNGVCLYQEQALVLINQSAKDASAINDFAEEIKAIVKAKTGILIEREVSSF
jgi:UDP-N-acetylmuramate dehydrogenase